MYSRLADENASTKGRTLGRTADAGVRHQGAEQPGGARDDIQDQRAPPAVPGGKQNGDVADFLGNLVRRHRDRGVDTERDGGQHRRAHDRAVDEIMEGVAEQHERSGRAVDVALIGMAVTEQHQPLEHEEGQDAGEQRAEHVGGRQRLQRLGQQREKRDAEQRADGVADEPRNEAGADFVGEEQQRRGDEQTAEAAEKAQPQGGREQARDILLARLNWSSAEAPARSRKELDTHLARHVSPTRAHAVGALAHLDADGMPAAILLAARRISQVVLLVQFVGDAGSRRVQVAGRPGRSRCVRRYRRSCRGARQRSRGRRSPRPRCRRRRSLGR